MLRWRINTDTHTHTPAHYRAHPWASGRKEGRQTKGRIPHATLRTTLLVTGRLGESCTAECYFSPPYQWPHLSVSHFYPVSLTLLEELVISWQRGLWYRRGQGKDHWFCLYEYVCHIVKGAMP